MYWRAPPSYLRHCNCDWLNHTTWSNGNCWPSPLYTTWYGRCHFVSSGPGYVWLAKPYNVVLLKASAARKHGIWVNIAPFFYTIQMPICYVGCLIIANTWTYISLYLRNTAILENTCDLHILVNCAKCEQIPSKYVSDWSVWKVFLKFIKFQSHLKEIYWWSSIPVANG